MEGGTAHGLEQLMCVRGAPPPYIKEGEGRRPALGAPQVGGFLLGLLVGFDPPFLLPEGERGKEREEEKERGAQPPPLVQFGLLPCGGRATPLWAGVPPSYGPYGPYLPPGGSRTTICTQSGTVNNIRSPNHITHIIQIVIEC